MLPVCINTRLKKHFQCVFIDKTKSSFLSQITRAAGRETRDMTYFIVTDY